MDQVIWVEILNRQSGVAARYRCAGAEVRIGRSYANDVVVDDPFVAPEHLRITRDEHGRLVAEDLGSINGLFVANGTERLARIAVDGRHALRIGHTLIRVRETNDMVAPERVAQTALPTYLTITAIAAAILGLEALMLWLNETGVPRFSIYAGGLLGLVGVVVVWVAAWATIARIFASHAHFQRHLFIAVSGLLTYSLAMLLVGFVAFALPWRPLWVYRYGGIWYFFAAICFFHLREIGPSHLRLKAGIVVVLASLAIAAQTIVQSELNANTAQRTYALQLMPPVLRLLPAKKEESFFAGIEALKLKLDQDRADALKQE